ncbi:unnamed protein product [Cuscuta epithymum]|uniref:Uncharacterized protein n=1 Tax=Cuscuta epithymum TaxID=186058 RepID=A0AAV0F613_9ASTE|nr:unnamed protein product [Cuscuta epithymum]
MPSFSNMIFNKNIFLILKYVKDRIDRVLMDSVPGVAYPKDYCGNNLERNQSKQVGERDDYIYELEMFWCFTMGKGGAIYSSNKCDESTRGDNLTVEGSPQSGWHRQSHVHRIKCGGWM